MRWAWLSGWGVPPEAVGALVKDYFPGHQHWVTYPGKDWLAHYPEGADLYLGHSLGAFLLMREPEASGETVRVLLSPFCDFRAESGLGGRVRTVQLKVLLKMLHEDPVAALNDFYKRAGLPYTCTGELPYSQEDLIWGIEQLLETEVSPEAFMKSPKVWIGGKDKLLDSKPMRPYCPQLRVINSAGHALEDVLPHIAV